ncbi:DUF202 domain-containing protein [Frankia sp. CIT1]|uniref:DUF202 domain-containing protein n=1 Tax=Frankia sp. CIT1 TaxID=2880974 RepID=UPI001EF7055B|nr:DUF202 domain-containing protein [Frankia sp. CIT1]
MTRPRLGHPSEIPDPGLQSERTYLAWQRTGLSFAAVGVFLVHESGHVGHPKHLEQLSHLAVVLPGILGLATGALIMLYGLLRYRQAATAALTGADGMSAPTAVAALAAVATLVAVGGFLILLAGAF